MTPEQLKELKEKAELWDSLSDTLRTIFLGKFERPDGGVVTIENTSNANTFIDVLKEANKEIAKGYVGLLEEESKEWCGYCCQEVKNAKV